MENYFRKLNRGAYILYGGEAVSTVHRDEELNRIIRAAEEASKEMFAK